MAERWREPISAVPSVEVVEARANQGWRAVAIEWVREATASPADVERRPIPYGLRIAPDFAHLEVDPTEREVLSLVVAMIADDHALSEIADELNRREFRTRRGTEWTQIGLFKMLPRIVEVGPEILSAETWSDSKKKALSGIG